MTRREKDLPLGEGRAYSPSMRKITAPATPIALRRHRVITPPPMAAVEIEPAPGTTYHVVAVAGELGSPSLGRYERLTVRPPRKR